eukprot:scaffold646_cov367-Prasinococcus_capsulatus_cf.AAC.5
MTGQLSVEKFTLRFLPGVDQHGVLRRLPRVLQGALVPRRDLRAQCSRIRDATFGERQVSSSGRHLRGEQLKMWTARTGVTIIWLTSSHGLLARRFRVMRVRLGTGTPHIASALALVGADD